MASPAENRVVVSVGVLAYNEETSIADTLASILAQTMVTSPPSNWEVEIVCVPNGCQDRTAEVARRTLTLPERNDPHSRVAGRVEVIERPSKHNAWNEFVHRLSRVDATHLVLMDGDIRLVGERSLELMVRRLLASPDAFVCGARTLKDVETARTKGLLGSISLGASMLRRHESQRRSGGGFAGCLYACPASACRRMILPEVLVGEDSFLSAMWITNFFTNPVNVADSRRVVYEKDATVMFEAYLGARAILKNQRRRMVGLTINSMLYDKLWAEASREADAGVLLTRWSNDDPEWDRKWIDQRIVQRGRWTLPGGTFLQWMVSRDGLWRWFTRMRGMPYMQKVATLPAAIVGTMLIAYAAITANRLIRRRQLGGLWFTTKTTLPAVTRDKIA